MSERAKLYLRLSSKGFTAGLALATLSACSLPSHAPTPSYEASSRRLVRLDTDADGDGFVEQRTYLEGNVPFRTELDADADGRVDRWEYVDALARVIKVGGSSRNDGVEDEWIYAAEENGERRVERSSERTARVDRREFYRGDNLVRAEEDTNSDGVIDKWETFEGGVLREVALDARRGPGRPDRRLVYDTQGKFLRLETDDDGDGRFEVAGTAPSPAPVVRE